MQIQVHYQNIDRSPWIDQFIERRLEKIGKYLANSATVHVHLALEKTVYNTNIAIHNALHHYAFSADGENLYESFSLATDKASRALVEHKKQIKNRIHESYDIREKIA